MQIYNLYASITASANNAAQLQIVKTGRIIGVQWAIYADLDAADELYVVELATVPIIQAGANNTSGTISAVRDRATGAEAAGYVLNGRNLFVPLSYKIDAGSFLYLNASLTGTQSVVVNALIQVA